MSDKPGVPGSVEVSINSMSSSNLSTALSQAPRSFEMTNDTENRSLQRGANWFERSLTSSNLTSALNPPPPPPTADPPPPPTQDGK